MSPPSPSLRIAAPHEIDLLVEIDDDAGALQVASGIVVSLPPDDPFLMLERRRWLTALETGGVRIAVAPDGRTMGFAALGVADGAPHLDQLSVRPAFMRRGVGSALLRWAIAESAPRGFLWLTTYAHLPFNQPFYEREGFVAMPDAECGPEVRGMLDLQRASLPQPDQRVAMVWRATR